MRSKVRLKSGETDWHDVLRGVAQGAVESPWLYSCFIDGMAAELKARGLGVMVEGRRVPLLMYADDIVMLASTVTELRMMNDVASEYAFKYRFRHNGKKSAVMAFNADAQTKQRVNREVWRLSGERVAVTQEYKYLGVDVTVNVNDWRTHVKRLIGKAQARTRDLAWMCGRDSGLRPRSAATLFKAIVRPILEYAAELWCGEIPLELAAKAEAVQTNFAKTILGLQGQRALTLTFLRAELGLEKLAARWEKLRLGYWRRIQVAKPGRALVLVANARRRQLRWEGGAELSWMRQTRKLLRERGLAEYWTTPAEVADIGKYEWRDKVYEQVEEHYERERELHCSTLLSASRYMAVKCWDKMDADRAEMKGEVGQRGSLVVERYLDDVKERLGSRLKLLCRAGCLPVLGRVAWELDLSEHHGKCVLCDSGEVEDVEHVLLRCPAHQHHRTKMMDAAGAVYAVAHEGEELEEASTETQIRVLLGARAGSRATEDIIDVQVKRFLVKVWKARRRVSEVINEKFGRQDVVWAKDWGWSKPQPIDKRTARRRRPRECSPPRRVGAGEAREARTSAALAAPGAGKGARRRLFG